VVITPRRRADVCAFTHIQQGCFAQLFQRRQFRLNRACLKSSLMNQFVIDRHSGNAAARI